MSKRKRSLIIIAALILLMALAFRIRYTLLVAQIAAIEADVSDIRGLERLQDTNLIFLTHEQFKAESPAPSEENDPDDNWERLFAFYRALDLAPPQIDLEAVFLDFYSANVAGYYEFESADVTILRPPEVQYAPLSFFERIVYAHEFTHVLQDQHYDLSQFWERVTDSDDGENYDRALAVNALIEGDAEKVAWELLDRLLARMSDRELEHVVRQSEQVSSVPATPKHVPAVIEAEFHFPYEHGYEFVNVLVENLGWDGLHQAFTDNPPSTTEQIYHPQRYLAGEGALPVEMPDLSAVGGDWRMVYDGPVGEFYLRQHLTVVLSEPRISLMADGWGGDRLQIFAQDDIETLTWMMRQRWDTSVDADEFARGYRYWLQRRYRSASEDGVCWIGARSHCIAQIGDDETRIVHAASPQTARALLLLDDL